MLVPKLRFREFNDEWQKSKLISVSQIFKGNGLSKNDLSKDGKDCILYGELYTNYGEIIKDIKSKTNKNSKVFVLSKYNDVIIPSSGETPIDIAKASCVLKSNVILGGDLNIIRLNDIDGRFLSYEFNSKLKLELANLSQGHSIVHLYGEKFKNIEIKFPCKEEQKKIANTIELLNKKIELQSQKVEALKLYKKGLSRKLFDEMPILKEIKLGDICNITTGKLDANAMKDNGKYRFYTCAKDYYYINDYAFDTEALLISGNGANVGYIHYYKGKFNAYQRTYILNNFKNNIIFIKNYLDENLAKRINSEKKEGNTPYIVLSTLSDMKIKLTNFKTENIINNILNIINYKINSEELKLDKLQKFKKGLIQNMFV